MRFLRFIVPAVFVLVCTAALFFNLKVKPDASAPLLTCSVSEIEAPCSVAEAELLKYVSASDEKDGNLSSEVFVESISQFIEEGVSVVNFCVSDSDGNIAKKSVRLVYTDYEKPQFVLHDDLVFAKGGTMNLSNVASVTDKFDGDITDRLYTIVPAGEDDDSPVNILFKVTGSKGFTYQWNFKMVRLDTEKLGSPLYKIKLKNNCIFVSRNSGKIDCNALVEGVYENGRLIRGAQLVVDDSQVDTSRSGTYDVWFRFYTGKGKDRVLAATERLIVVCEGGGK